jgi:hypothetical protein
MKPNLKRRRFLKALAATAAVAPVAALPGVALSGPARGDDPPPSAPTPAQALADLVRARFGRHLNEAQLKLVQTDIEGTLRSAEALNRLSLEHAEEPATVFFAEPE